MSINISVIVPAYNAEKYIERCIESICSQTLKEVEIIVINDGSTDGTADILNHLAVNDDRIKLVHKENQGQGAARNDGIRISKGEYITFVDADDWLDTRTYETSMKLIMKENPDVFVYNYSLAYPNGHIEQQKNFDNRKVEMGSLDKGAFLYDYFFTSKIGSSVWNKLYRSKLIKENDIEMGNTKVGEDFYFNLLVMLHAENIYLFNKSMYYYYQPSQSVTRSYSKGITTKYMNYLSTFIELLEKKGKTEEYYSFSPFILYRALSAGMFNAYASDRKITSIYQEINSANNNLHFRRVVNDTLKNDYLSIVPSQYLKKSMVLLFRMLDLKIFYIASIYQWVRFKKNNRVSN